MKKNKKIENENNIVLEPTSEVNQLKENKKNGFFNKWKKLQKGFKLLIISLVLLFIGTLGATLTQTNGGSVSITGLNFPTENGQNITADLYKPKSVNAKNKAPLVVIVPGFQRSKETQSSWSLELSRRGFVVLTIDPYAQGDSSASDSTQAATAYGYGLFSIIDYITTPSINGDYVFNYIDQDKIAAVGHSAGGNAVVKAASLFGQEVVDGLRKKSRLSAVYVSGYVRSFTDGDLKSIRSNMGMSYAYYDEGAYQNETQKAKDNGTWVWGDDIANGDMRYAPESIRFVNSGLKLNKEDELKSIEIGKVYGNPYNNTLRYVNNEKTIHAMQPYDFNSIANFIDFFEIAFDVSFSISSMNQIWLVKEMFTGTMLVAGLLFAFSIGDLLLKLKFFRSLVHEKGPKVDQSKIIDKSIFWITFTISAVVACFIFIPLASWSQKLFPQAQGGILTWFFPQRMTNSIMLWALFSGIIGFVLYFIVYFTRCYKKGVKLDSMKLTWGEAFKTILLAVTVFVSYYMLILLIYTLFRVDFRFLFISARPILNAKYLILLLMYAPVFFVFYLSNSVRVNNSMRIEGMKEGTSLLIAVLGNTVGLALILVIQYCVFGASGQVYWKTEWLYCNMLFGVIPMMGLLPIVNRYFYNRTGKVYLGPSISVLIFIMMTLTNTVCYLPL